MYESSNYRAGVKIYSDCVSVTYTHTHVRQPQELKVLYFYILQLLHQAPRP